MSLGHVSKSFSACVVQLFVVTLALLLPGSVIAAETLPLKDAVPASHCSDPEMRLLTSQGHSFSCFTDDDAVTPRVCTISGKCETPKISEKTGPSTTERWLAFGTRTLDKVLVMKVAAEDFAFTLLPQFIRERSTRIDAFFGAFAPANRAMPEVHESVKDFLSQGGKKSAGGETYEAYVSRTRMLQGGCDNSARVPGVFALLVPLFPQSNCRTWGNTVLGSEKIKNEERNTPQWIRAEPSLVLLGERATMHWGVGNGALPHSCAVLGPGLALRSDAGSASTIPITRPATFTLTCITLNGATTSVSTTIDLAL